MRILLFNQVIQLIYLSLSIFPTGYEPGVTPLYNVYHSTQITPNHSYPPKSLTASEPYYEIQNVAP